jgi:hypothetical protein
VWWSGMIGPAAAEGGARPLGGLAHRGGRRVTATGSRLDRGLEPAPAAHQRPTSALATPSIPLNRQNRPPVHQPAGRSDDGAWGRSSGWTEGPGGCCFEWVASRPPCCTTVRAATYETLIADTDCGRLITWVGGGERGLLRNVRFRTATCDSTGSLGAAEVTSSVRVRTRSPLCGPTFSQIALDRQGQIRRSQRWITSRLPG